MDKRIAKTVSVGGILIGGGNPIPVQTMTNTDARDREATLRQLHRLETVGCDIVRLAVPDEDAAEIFRLAKADGIRMPMVADIHFDHKLALAAIRAGADKIRINPGNIGAEWKVKEVADACRAAGLPIRIGVNGGSLDKTLLEKYGSPSAEALAESALLQAEMLEKFGFSDTVISIKSSRIKTMTDACRIVAAASDYPLHIGVTEAGDDYSGLVKNAIGIGSLLSDGIGDTIRVSLTADPVEELKAGYEILSALDLNAKGGIRIVSCPTCGRTRINLFELSSLFRKAAEKLDTKGKTVTVALMGCVVNGPGEAREADIGVAGGDGYTVLFRRGETVCRLEESETVPRLIEEIKKLINT